MSEHEIEYDTIPDAVAAIKNGELVIVVDAADRENEADFICAAESITAERVDFMLRKGAGLFCVPLASEVADRLRLPPIVTREQNTSQFQTNFLMYVDHRDSGTGISMESRTMTIRALADPQATPDDFIGPGHIAPILGKDGGVLRRAGHTEATLDLLSMAELNPVGALIEICSQRDNGMARSAELQEISQQFHIPIVSIGSLIQHRRQRERLVSRQAIVPIPTEFYGVPTAIAYRVEHEDQEPLALVWGDIAKAEKPPLVRMHSSCFTGDVLDSLRCDCGDQLHMAMAMIHGEGVGAVVYLPQEGRGIGLTAKLRAYELQDKGLDTVEANHKLGFKADQRDYMIGLQVLKDLGLKEVRLLTNNPKKTDAFEQAWDLKVVEQVPIIAPAHERRSHYMATKREKLGHLIPKGS